MTTDSIYYAHLKLPTTACDIAHLSVLVLECNKSNPDVNKLYILSYQITQFHKITYTAKCVSVNHTLVWVYSTGNLNECCPMAGMFGSRPALGMMFHDRVSVTLL